MWYVVWTTTGSELKLISWISEFISGSIYDDCFCPRVEQVKKIHGELKTSYKTLFPGYIFVNSDSKRIEQFEDYLKRYDDFALLLSTDGIISHIDDEDIFYIENAYANGGILGSSIGYIENDRVRILSGPLKGREGDIKQIDRHKRNAVLELNLFGRISKVILALEVISKSKS